VLAALEKAAAEDPDDSVRMAAVEALAGYPEGSHDEIMVRAAKSELAEERRRAHVARLRLAHTLAAAGNKAAAARICQAVLKSDAPAAQKKAAQLALKA
jgi:HEAT repeat protein